MGNIADHALEFEMAQYGDYPDTWDDTSYKRTTGDVKQEPKPSLDTKFPFGKHKGVSVAEVIQTDLKWFEWLLKTEREKPFMTGAIKDAVELAAKNLRKQEVSEIFEKKQ